MVTSGPLRVNVSATVGSVTATGPGATDAALRINVDPSVAPTMACWTWGFRSWNVVPRVGPTTATGPGKTLGTVGVNVDARGVEIMPVPVKTTTGYGV
jgi:hypothetical protein